MGMIQKNSTQIRKADKILYFHISLDMFAASQIYFNLKKNINVAGSEHGHSFGLKISNSLDIFLGQTALAYLVVDLGKMQPNDGLGCEERPDMASSGSKIALQDPKLKHSMESSLKPSGLSLEYFRLLPCLEVNYAILPNHGPNMALPWSLE